MRRLITVSLITVAFFATSMADAAAQEESAEDCVCGGVASGTLIGAVGAFGTLAWYHRFLQPAYDFPTTGQWATAAVLIVGGIASGIEMASDGNVGEAWEGALEGAAWGLLAGTVVGGITGLLRDGHPEDLWAGLIGGAALGMATGFLLEGLADVDRTPGVTMSVSLPVRY